MMKNITEFYINYNKGKKYFKKSIFGKIINKHGCDVTVTKRAHTK